jgi:hypothetical protein
MHSKIDTLMGGVRVGRETFSAEREMDDGALVIFGKNDDGALQLANYEVAVPCDRVPHLEVDLQVQSSENHLVNHVEVVRFTDDECQQSHRVDSHEVDVRILWERKTNLEDNGEKEYVTISCPQPTDNLPVKVKQLVFLKRIMRLGTNN